MSEGPGAGAGTKAGELKGPEAGVGEPKVKPTPAAGNADAGETKPDGLNSSGELKGPEAGVGEPKVKPTPAAGNADAGETKPDGLNSSAFCDTDAGGKPIRARPAPGAGLSGITGAEVGAGAGIVEAEDEGPKVKPAPPLAERAAGEA